MERSVSCLRIISCAGGSTDPEEAGAVDQGLKVRKGWGFKKRSSSGRAVSKSVIVETSSPRHKENLKSAAITFETASESVVSEKDSAVQWDEKKPQPVAADLYVTENVTISAPEKQPAAVTSYVTDNATVSKHEKQSVTADSDVTDAATISKTEEDKAVFVEDESVVIVIQSAIRGFLARKKQIKHESVVKLQAAVRGHLVRCHAIGALRCVQAIAKMQVLIRARYVRLSLEEQAVESNEKGTCTRKLWQDRKLPKKKAEITYTSMNELLKSSFARQLLESSPKSKRIKIKCDPLSRDSSWVWLERWMSLASPRAVDEHVGGIETGHEEKIIEKEQEENISVEDYLFHEENEIFSETDNVNYGTSVGDSKLTALEKANLINSDITDSDKDFLPVSSVERQTLDTIGDLDMVEPASKMDSVNRPVNASVDARVIDSVIEKSEFEIDQAVELKTELGSEQQQAIKLETEEDDIVSGCGTERSLPFIPVVSKIEELVSIPKSANLASSEPQLVSVPNVAISSVSAPQIAGEEELISVPNSAILYDDAVPLTSEVKELVSVSVPNSVNIDVSVPDNAEAEELVPHIAEINLNIETATSSGDDIIFNHTEPSQQDHSSIPVGGSECGTELSVNSTLDSPERSEIRSVQIKSEKIDSRDAESHIPEESNILKLEIKTESGSEEKEKTDDVSGKSAECVTAVDTGKEKKELETNASSLQLQPEAGEEKTHEASKSNLTSTCEDSEKNHQTSPGASPRSQVTVTESQGTPSSQVSVSTKPKSAKTKSIKKGTILSAAKRSPMNSTNDSGGKSSVEALPKDEKSVKRRTSFSSPKPDIADQEHRRDSSSSSSLPSYMQATESARAKANAGHSPRSSPDVADKDVFLRKPHSLSGAKDRQESPKLQRTSSQAQSGSKSNGTSPLERKWQR